MNVTANGNEPRRRPRYVLDTDTVSAHQREAPVIEAHLTSVSRAVVATTVVTLHEQFRGRIAVINRARDEASMQRAYQWLESTLRYFCGANVLPFDVAAAAIFRLLVAQRVRIGAQDLKIAAIALAHDATLVTSNRRDFVQVPGLRIEDWNMS